MQTIRSILISFPEIKQVYIYGSRAMMNYNLGSDIDLAIMNEDISFQTVVKLKSAFAESSLPYRVEVLAYADLQHQGSVAHIQEVGKLIFQRDQATERPE